MKRFSMFILLAAGLIVLVGCNKTSTTTDAGNLDAFAQCLTDAGAKMYGSPTCPHCLKQKEMFGESFEYITYVDCVASPTLCGALNAVPTREFADGSMAKGIQSFEDLSEKTSCPLP